MKLQGVIFDLDGVITDTAHLHFQAWQQIAAEIGISIDAQFNESLKGISRDESLRRILQHGGKEGDFNSQERAQLAYRKNLLYVHSLRELTVNAVLPGIRSLLGSSPCTADPGWAGFCLPECADDFSGAGAARVFHLLRGCFPT